MPRDEQSNAQLAVKDMAACGAKACLSLLVRNSLYVRAPCESGKGGVMYKEALLGTSLIT